MDVGGGSGRRFGCGNGAGAARPEGRRRAACSGSVPIIRIRLLQRPRNAEPDPGGPIVGGDDAAPGWVGDDQAGGPSFRRGPSGAHSLPPSRAVSTRTRFQGGPIGPIRYGCSCRRDTCRRGRDRYGGGYTRAENPPQPPPTPPARADDRSSPTSCSARTHRSERHPSSCTSRDGDPSVESRGCARSDPNRRRDR